MPHLKYIRNPILSYSYIPNIIKAITNIERLKLDKKNIIIIFFTKPMNLLTFLVI